jgi:hypothetical protein
MLTIRRCLAQVNACVVCGVWCVFAALRVALTAICAVLQRRASRCPRRYRHHYQYGSNLFIMNMSYYEYVSGLATALLPTLT